MARNLPFVSFIIPTFNEERNIKSCIDSILLQDYPEDRMEIIVVDGYSSDKTLQILQKYPVKIFLNKKKIASEARNIAVKNAKGDLLAFLDADCELFQPNWLRLMIRPILDNPKVAGSLAVLTPNKNYPAISRFFSLMQADPFIIFAYGSISDVKGKFVTETNYFPMGIRVIRRKLLTDFNFKSTLNRLEDVDVTYRLVHNGYKFAAVKQAGFYHLLIDGMPSYMKKTFDKVKSFTDVSSNCDFKFKVKRDFFRIVFLNIIGIDSSRRMLKGIRQSHDLAWFYYPLVLLSTLMFYMIVVMSRGQGRTRLRALLGRNN